MSVTDTDMSTEACHQACSIVDYGDQALMLQCDSTADVLAWTAAVRAAALGGVVDVVPASRTVLVKLHGPRFQGAIRQRLRKLQVTSAPVDDDGKSPEVIIEVAYDGPDLAEVADYTGLSAAQVIDAHTSTRWRVGFSGFAPGFAYLIGGDERLRVPRRSEPRTSLSAGSVGLAGEFSAIYPRRSPGGWQIIGHTDAVVWDIDRPDPALLTQGAWVRFQAS